MGTAGPLWCQKLQVNREKMKNWEDKRMRIMRAGTKLGWEGSELILFFFYRRDISCPVGGHHRDHTAVLCNWLCLLHHKCVGQVRHTNTHCTHSRAQLSIRNTKKRWMFWLWLKECESATIFWAKTLSKKDLMIPGLNCCCCLTFSWTND